MTSLILANDGVIVAALEGSVTFDPTYGYIHADGMFPLSAGVTDMVVVDELPADFTPAHYRFRAGALVQEVSVEQLDEMKHKLRGALAERRWRAETGGIIIEGVSEAVIDTSRESQAMMSGAMLAAQNGVATSFDWKIGPGAWATVSAEQLTLIASAVAAHVQACFSNERAIETQISAATTLEELRAIDINSGWED